MVDHWAQRIGAPRVDRIELVDALTASAGAGRRSFLGPKLHAIRLGLPLLQIMTTAEATAVLIHELAHLRHSDHRGRIVIAYTHSLLAALAAPWRAKGGWMEHMLRRARERFTDEDMRMRRDHEREADTTAARFIGSGVFAQALVRSELGSVRMMERVLDQLDALERGGKRISASVCAPWGYSEPDDRDPAWMRMILARPTDPNSSHPSIADRLRSLGVEPRDAWIPAPVLETESAAAEWLGEARHALLNKPTPLPAEGASETIEAASEVPADETADRLAEEMLASASASEPGSCYCAHLMLLRCGKQQQARELLERLSRDPAAGSEVLTWIIRVSLRESGPHGLVRSIAALSRLEDADPRAHVESTRLLADRFALAGRMVEAKAAWRLVLRGQERVRNSELWQESSLIPDDLDEHGLEMSEIETLSRAIGRDRGITKFWIARSDAGVPASRSRIVIALSAPRAWWNRPRKLRNLKQRLANQQRLRIDIIDFDLCARATQDRLRILEASTTQSFECPLSDAGR